MLSPGNLKYQPFYTTMSILSEFHIYICFTTWYTFCHCSLEEFIKPASQYSSGYDLWVGLVNPKLEKCNNDACLNTLVWLSDGAPFTDRPNNQAMQTNNPLYCFLRHYNKKVDDYHCWQDSYIVCEFSCDKGIALKILIRLRLWVIA